MQNQIYNIQMGRMRIKKKEAVLPFQETIAFRMILLTASFIVFIIALYFLIGAFRTSLPLAIAWGVAVVGAAIAIFYNLDHMRDAKIPKHTMNRMKRR
jgi:uncharacterized membrane protein (GlpM family)